MSTEQNLDAERACEAWAKETYEPTLGKHWRCVLFPSNHGDKALAAFKAGMEYGRRTAPVSAPIVEELPPPGLSIAHAELSDRLGREVAENLSLRMENRQYAERIRQLGRELAERKRTAAWDRVETVGDMVRNLLTLDQSTPIHAAFHVDIAGERRCRTRPVSISRERVIDGKWVDSRRKDVPYAIIVWAKQDERAYIDGRTAGAAPDGGQQ
jgi:hypothetical protein